MIHINDRIVISGRGIVYIVQHDEDVIKLGDVYVDKDANSFVVKSLDIPKNVGKNTIAVTLKGIGTKEPSGEELIRNGESLELK